MHRAPRPGRARAGPVGRGHCRAPVGEEDLVRELAEGRASRRRRADDPLVRRVDRDDRRHPSRRLLDDDHADGEARDGGLERAQLLGALATRHVLGVADEPDHPPFGVPERRLGREEGADALGGRHRFLDDARLTRRHDLPVGLHQGLADVAVGVDLAVRPPDDLLEALAHRSKRRLVDEPPAARLVLQEERIRDRVEDVAQQRRALGEGPPRLLALRDVAEDGVGVRQRALDRDDGRGDLGWKGASIGAPEVDDPARHPPLRSLGQHPPELRPIDDQACSPERDRLRLRVPEGAARRGVDPDDGTIRPG